MSKSKIERLLNEGTGYFVTDYLPDSSSVVVGIDVGDKRKGFHAVALRKGSYLKRLTECDVDSVVAWCLDMGAGIIGIDAPCRWSCTGVSRSAERSLAAEGIFCFATPTREKAANKPFYGWMRNGFELYSELAGHYPLFNGEYVSGPVCFETFPHAVACALAGEIVSARHRRTIGPKLLHRAGINTTAVKGDDFIDAALCALTANYFLKRRIKTYGDITEGFIVVPSNGLRPNAL